MDKTQSDLDSRPLVAMEESVAAPEASAAEANSSSAGGGAPGFTRTGYLDFHPFAKLFPMPTDEELAGMAEDIRLNGQQELILLTPENPPRLLDGLRRYVACRIAKVEPRFETTQAPEESWLSLVISKNAVRRHAPPNVRAAVAAELVTTNHGDNRFTARPPKLGEWQVAQLFGVSLSYVEYAVKVKKKSPELLKLVKADRVRVDDAAQIVGRPAKQIREFVRLVQEGKSAEEAKASIEDMSVGKDVPPPKPVGGAKKSGSAEERARQDATAARKKTAEGKDNVVRDDGPRNEPGPDAPPAQGKGDHSAPSEESLRPTPISNATEELADLIWAVCPLEKRPRLISLMAMADKEEVVRLLLDKQSKEDEAKLGSRGEHRR